MRVMLLRQRTHAGCLPFKYSIIGVMVVPIKQALFRFFSPRAKAAPVPEPSSNTEDDSSLTAEERSGVTAFLKMAAPVLFEKAILDATSDDKRNELAESFARSPLTDFDTTKQLIELAAYLSHQKDRESDASVILRYAKRTMNVFLNERVKIIKNGISVQHEFDGQIIKSTGHALNEGVTEWLARKVMGDDKIASVVPGMTKEAIQEHLAKVDDEDGTYFFEVKAADMLINLATEQCVMKAYFGEDMQPLASVVEQKCGPGSFFKLLSLSDSGEWKQVFSLLRP